MIAIIASVKFLLCSKDVMIDFKSVELTSNKCNITLHVLLVVAKIYTVHTCNTLMNYLVRWIECSH